MKKLTAFLFVSIGLLGFSSITTSCGGGKSTETSSESTQVAPVSETPSAEQMALGKGIYEAKCKACHQAEGQGLKPAFPPLAGSDYLLTDKKRAVAQVLNGSNHEITVNGVKYNAPMPQQVGSIDSAVAVVNFVLNSFGNNGGIVNLDDVKDISIDPRK
jgi:nitrite reductase (NO-forming)